MRLSSKRVILLSAQTDGIAGKTVYHEKNACDGFRKITELGEVVRILSPHQLTGGLGREIAKVRVGINPVCDFLKRYFGLRVCPPQDGV